MGSQTGHLEIGCFVWTSDRYGIGQVISLKGERCVVRFFKSISDSVDKDYAIGQVKQRHLFNKTRVYVLEDDGFWAIGRIETKFIEGNVVSYDVQFPNKRYLRVAEAEIRVRCLLQLDDPTSVLAAGGIETQFFHDRRRAALQSLTEGRAVCSGLEGLVSASVELLPHQVDIVRRITNDPIQRYLLADEVGLGKTIEACAIVKQAILDNPEERVVVLCPPSITGQWRSELSQRFFINEDEHGLSVLSFDQMDEVDPSSLDTLVIDESHNLIPGEPRGNLKYEKLERIATAAHRLLLISATPVLGQNRTLLALLHLLDPFTFSLDDEDAFIGKVVRRQEFGRLLLAIGPNQPPAMLQRTLQLLREQVPDDEIANQFIDRVEEQIGTPPTDEFAISIRALRRHIGDTYRIHQRIVRTRRRDLPEDILAPRTSALVQLEEDDDDRTPLLVDAIDEWRQRSLEALESVAAPDSDDFEFHLSNRFERLHESLGISVEACAIELKSQLDRVHQGLEVTFDEDEEALAHAILQTGEETEGTRAGMATIVIKNALQRLRGEVNCPRVVAFGTSTDFVISVAEQIGNDRFIQVFRIVESSSEEEIVEAVKSFFTTSEPTVLMCDRRGEEGLNLQLAHGIVHLDIPLDPARIEQRIGRLDRFGRERNALRDIYHWVLSPYFDSYHAWQAWYELLRDGFNIFDESISEVQFLLDELRTMIRLALYRRGSEGLRELTPHIKEALAAERQRLDEQYALDQRTVGTGEADEMFQDLERVDAARHYQPTIDFLTEVLQFRRQYLSDSNSEFNLHWSERTLLPIMPWQDVLRKDDLAKPMTYERIRATRIQDIRLIRPGIELLDSLQKFLAWDDRGTAFATWRWDQRWVGEGRGIWLGFRMIYLLEANTGEAIKVLERSSVSADSSSIRRRMDALLPPWTAVLDVDVEMNPVNDPLLQDILAQPYLSGNNRQGRQDFNLSSRREALYEVIGYRDLAHVCQLAREASGTLLRNSSKFQSWSETSVRTAVGDLINETARLTRRTEANSRESEIVDSNILREIRINEAIEGALAKPSVKLDSIGLFVVSGSRLADMDDSEDWS